MGSIENNFKECKMNNLNMRSTKLKTKEFKNK